MVHNTHTCTPTPSHRCPQQDAPIPFTPVMSEMAMDTIPSSLHHSPARHRGNRWRCISGVRGGVFVPCQVCVMPRWGTLVDAHDPPMPSLKLILPTHTHPLTQLSTSPLFFHPMSPSSLLLLLLLPSLFFPLLPPPFSSGHPGPFQHGRPEELCRPALAHCAAALQWPLYGHGRAGDGPSCGGLPGACLFRNRRGHYGRPPSFCEGACRRGIFGAREGQQWRHGGDTRFRCDGTLALAFALKLCLKLSLKLVPAPAPAPGCGLAPAAPAPPKRAYLPPPPYEQYLPC